MNLPHLLFPRLKEGLEFSIEEPSKSGGICVAQSVKHLTSAQVTISRFVSWSPVLGSVLTAWNLESASDSVSLFLSVPPQLTLCLSLAYKNK